MDRETLTLTTKGGNVVVYKSYATGREAREIESKYLSSVQVDLGGEGKPNLSKFDTSAVFEAEKAAIGLLVVSIDGKTDNIVETALDLRQEDYEQIVAAINEITKKKK